MTEYYTTEAEIEQLVKEFISHSLDKNKWTHAAHLTVAAWHLKKFNINEATCLLRSGIISYNLSVGNKNNGSEGYHEKLTVFWISVVSFFVQKHPHQAILETCNTLLASTLADKALPFYFYEKEYILSQAGRANFIPADKEELNHEHLENILQQALSAV